MSSSKIRFWKSLCTTAWMLMVSAICHASLPMSPPMPLNVFLRNSNTIVFKGRFEGIFYISESLNEKLTSRRGWINPNELVIAAELKGEKIGQPFMVVSSVRLMAASAGLPEFEIRRNCRHEYIYLMSNIVLHWVDAMSVHYKSLMGKDVVLFTTRRTQYGRHPIDFPAPYFLQPSGENWSDGKFLPIESLGEVINTAVKEKYIDYSSNACS